jgi:AraC-like DNA-binding protein
MSTVFETTDLSVAGDMLSQVYGTLRLSADGDGHRVRLTQDTLGPLPVHRGSFGMKVHVQGAPLGVLPFGRILRGTASYRTGRHTIECGPGDAVLAARPEDSYEAILDGLDADFVFLTEQLVAEAADPVPGRAPEPVRFTGNRPISPEACRIWIEAFRYVRDHVIGTPAAAEPLVATSAARMLVAAALSAFPNNVRRDPTVEDRHDAHPATLRRAVGYIDENAHRGISPADVAGACHVTIRTLQLAFRRHLDTTPSAYLRRVRLEHAHRDLVAAPPASTTVGAVAARWGFTNHSQFTAHYHAAYGLPPSRTLRCR